MTTGTIDKNAIATEMITLPAGAFVTVHGHAVQLTSEVNVVASTASAMTIREHLTDQPATDATGNR